MTTVVPGPVPGTRITEAYARLLTREAYVWAWPMANIYNKRLAFAKAPEPGLLGGVLPFPPLNRMSMLTDYVDPAERAVACPNQDVVYGGGPFAFDVSPVVVQVPDFGSRFWVYQIVDLRTDSFADLGAMYGTKPGFYLLVGPGWKGDVPAGITQVFHSGTNTGFFAPRAFQDDTPEDRRAIQAVINQIDVYPLAEFDGKMKTHDWSKLPHFPQPEGSGAETKWVFPETFIDQLPLLLDDATPLPGEASKYAALRELVAVAGRDPKLKAAMIDEAKKADAEIVAPLFEFRNYGVPLPHHWTTINNGAAFGTDYFTRTAVGKSNILVNKPNETKYFYQDLDEDGQRLNGANRYTVTFANGQLPPVKGFWSLTLYNQHHFFEPNAIKRYSVGTKNKDLQKAADGSLTIHVQADEPKEPAQRANWLPSPKGADFSLYVRAYWPEEAITRGQWTPPAVVKVR
ncbi:DUF1254 domain-containing protein [Lysobacter sp. KIS68-7]|uniref:DUF1254 domain-containing protein n=1 Tax=Lysobacter sp. KIS68-7 TaxID=2904252 RepID=UPI001E30DB55|nr:DUF1254 domain-containing protein [Lysobacter sp. KIS68-7]UHQ18577.1 DUF1254 domain-containing protein [Lysobacter sp. KIS68-7]